MRACLRGADAVARFGGDEFAVLLEDVADADAAFEVADRLQVALGVPFVVDGRRLGVGASVGATISHGGRDTAAALLREADASMYLAKHRGNVNLATLEMLAGAPAGGRAPAVDDDETFVAATA
ncbi:MAG TPA: GGDEF domain-containing protein, partial [Acidimicrobiia bacterium]|nr:GGDEF domain-containing protein [Acidimicrobiia bacterium]